MKFVLCKPSRGGFNDMLCQIYKCYRYCLLYRRVLLIDTSKSSYAFSFDKYFYFKPNRNIIVITNTDIIRKIVKRNQSYVYPNQMRNRLLNYSIECVHRTGIVDARTKTKLTFNFKIQYPETILLHDAYGGGTGSYTMYGLLKFKSHLKKIFSNRFKSLRKPYLCIYVRNTDMKSNYKKLYEDNKENLHRVGSIYLATDSAETLDFFKEKGLPITNFTTINNSKKNLHEANISADIKIKDMICDLLFMGLANKLITNSGGGFIRLGKYLNSNKVLVYNSFSIN